MMKNLFVFTMVMAFLVPTGASFAQDDSADPKAFCLQNFPKDNGTGIDAEAYCSCVAKQLGGKMNQSADNDEKGRKKAVTNIKPCLDKHAKAPITNMCKAYNDQVKAIAKDGGEKNKSLNCNCFYDKLVGNFTKAWSGQGGNDLSQKDQETLANDTVAGCLK